MEHRCAAVLSTSDELVHSPKQCTTQSSPTKIRQVSTAKGPAIGPTFLPNFGSGANLISKFRFGVVLEWLCCSSTQAMQNHYAIMLKSHFWTRNVPNVTKGGEGAWEEEVGASLWISIDSNGFGWISCMWICTFCQICHAWTPRQYQFRPCCQIFHVLALNFWV